MAVEAGYSGTPLPKKLGLKDGQSVLFVDLPESQQELASAREFGLMAECGWPDLASQTSRFDVVHGFTKQKSQLEQNIPLLQRVIVPDGMIWISWPKKAAKVETDVTEDVVRALALQTDLVDVKVCAVDAIWSGLKLVIRKEQRHLH